MCWGAGLAIGAAGATIAICAILALVVAIVSFTVSVRDKDNKKDRL
jgi:hypothetical protein